jgi:hypothetical protein
VFLLLGSYLLLVFVLPVALSAIVTYRALPIGRQCPQCSGETLCLRNRWLRLFGMVQRRTQLAPRWCLRCGWEGVVRQSRLAPVPRARIEPARRTTRGPASTKVTQTLDVRHLDVDGAAWRVMLQCWGRTGLFYGRLVFVAPSGRLWLDAVESFSGSNEHDVLGQALSLPEGLLENRLRRLVTE